MPDACCACHEQTEDWEGLSLLSPSATLRTSSTKDLAERWGLYDLGTDPSP
jgi:hypothetical protein